jgi:hypothetical protein
MIIKCWYIVAIAIDQTKNLCIRTVSAMKKLAPVSWSPDTDIMPTTAEHDIAIGCLTLLRAANEDIVSA